MIDALFVLLYRASWAVACHRRSAVRIPAGPPLTLIAGCDFKDRPSKPNTSTSFSSCTARARCADSGFTQYHHQSAPRQSASASARDTHDLQQAVVAKERRRLGQARAVHHHHGQIGAVRRQGDAFGNQPNVHRGQSLSGARPRCQRPSTCRCHCRSVADIGDKGDICPSARSGCRPRCGSFEQQLGHVDVVLGSGPHQRGLALEALSGVRRDAVHQQRLDGLRFARPGGRHQEQAM
jgi:hypothetical protein